MTNPAVDVDQVLKSLASQSIKQGGNIMPQCDLTLKALQRRGSRWTRSERSSEGSLKG
jgi:hypothetical protein